MSGIAVEDYVADKEPELTDPTDPYEQVDRDFMDQLAKLLTKVEEVLQVGTYELSLADMGKFISARGDVLDLLEDPVLAGWLDHMRQTARCPYRRFAVSG